MSVINNPEDRAGHTVVDSCSVCEQTLRFPYIVWEHIGLCRSCCLKIRKGFTADMIQLAAIAELLELYPRMTLVRKGNVYHGEDPKFFKYLDPSKTEPVDIRTGKSK